MLNVSLSIHYFTLPTASNPKYSSLRGYHGSSEPTNCRFGTRASYQFLGLQGADLVVIDHNLYYLQRMHMLNSRVL